MRTDKSLLEEFSEMEESCSLGNHEINRLEEAGLIITYRITQEMIDAGEHGPDHLDAYTGHVTPKGKALLGSSTQ